MEFVVTLLANPAKEALSRAFTDSMAPSLALQGITIEKTTWLKEGIACDLFVQHNSRNALDAHVANILRDQPYDAIVQPVANRRKKLLIADMESTIITCECLDELAEFGGIRDQIATITARAMNGELNFEEAITQRVGLLKGLDESALQRVMDEKVKLMPGAKELLAAIKKSGAYCMLVSGGFDFYTSRVKTWLGFDEARANKLEIKDGKLTGNIIRPILGKEAKLAALKEACVKMGITEADVLAVGDGANDLPMLLEAGLGVAYHAKPFVRAQARAQINHCDLSALVWAGNY